MVNASEKFQRNEISVKNRLQQIKVRFFNKEIHKSHWILVLGFFLFALIGLFQHWNEKSSKPPPITASPESPDTIIPKGFVLVPIELANADSLASLIGDFAIVDLYRNSVHGSGPGTRVGHQLRLLRAPLNPKTFAVLVPDTEARSIVGSGGPLLAVLQNNRQRGMGSMEVPSKKTSRVEYYSVDKQ
jgi:hypothetical protein